jgi:hypothetical protein
VKSVQFTNFFNNKKGPRLRTGRRKVLF